MKSDSDNDRVPWKKRTLIIASGLSLLTLMTLAGLLYRRHLQSAKGLAGIIDGLKSIEEEQARFKQMIDVYGGASARETLRSYITAVEKEDFELASRYLVEEKRSDEVRELEALRRKNNLEDYLAILKKADDDFAAGDIVRLKSKTPEEIFYFVRFIRYPNGVWKISEI